MMRRSCTAVALASLMLASPALAQKAPSAKDQQLASDLLQRAFAKLDASDYGAAIELFNKAYELVPDPLLLSNIGAAYEKDGNPRAALVNFCKYLSMAPTGTGAAFAAAQVRSLHVELGNDAATEQEACAAIKKGKRRGEPKPARSEQVRVEPDPVEEAEPEPSTKPAKPARTASKPPGETEIILGTGEQTERDRGGRPTEGAGISTLSYVGIATGALGLGSLGLGGYYTYRAIDLTEKTDAEDDPTKKAALRRQGESAEKRQIIALATGGALVTAGIIMYVLGRTSDSNADKRTVQVTPTSNGFVVFGAF